MKQKYKTSRELISEALIKLYPNDCEVNRLAKQLIETKKKNRCKLSVPEKDLKLVTINGYKFFRHENQFQCATCLNLMGLQPDEITGNNGTVRKLHIIKDCDCPKQK